MLIYGGKAFENKRFTLDLKSVFVFLARSLDLDVQRVIHGFRHLACQKSVVNEFIQAIQISLHFIFDAFGRDRQRNRTDRFVCVLYIVFGRVEVELFGSIFLPEILDDKPFRFRLRFNADTNAVRTDIGNQGGQSRTFDVDAFVQLLREFHDFGRGDLQAVRTVLLQCTRRERRIRMGLTFPSLYLVHEIFAF